MHIMENDSSYPYEMKYPDFESRLKSQNLHQNLTLDQNAY